MNRLLLIMIVLIFFASGCSNDDEVCTEKVNTLATCNFLQLKNGTIEDTVISGISVYGMGNEANLLYDSTNTSSIELPLNNNSSLCSFIITANNKTDTITFEYQSSLLFISYACGFASKFEVNSISTTYNAVDSISLIRNEVIPADEKNLEIYF